MNALDLSWIYGFWKEMAPFVFLRPEDQVVILPPNNVYKANPTGFKLLEFLESGGRFEKLPGWNEERARDVDFFFQDIKIASQGGEPRSLSVPYGFDFTTLPILGDIALTYRCNNRCLFCYAGCGSGTCGLPKGYNPDLEMGTREVKRVIRIFKKEAKIPFFSFTGGEPTLRKDLEELISYACGKGLRVNLISNGTLITPERAQSLHKAGLRTAQISLEAGEETLHDHLCGLQGAFSRTLSGIKSLQAAGIQVQTNSTVTLLNRENLLGLPDFLKTMGIQRFSMNLFIPTEKSPQSEALFIPYKDIGPFVDRIKSLAQAQGLTFYWYSPTPLCHYNPIARGLGNKSCAACDGLLHVNPQGEILPCSSFSTGVGSLRRQTFKEIWFSPQAQHHKMKKHAPEKCQSCASFLACQGACPLYWEYAGTEELEDGRNG